MPTGNNRCNYYLAGRRGSPVAFNAFNAGDQTKANAVYAHVACTLWLSITCRVCQGNSRVWKEINSPTAGKSSGADRAVLTDECF